MKPAAETGVGREVDRLRTSHRLVAHGSRAGVWGLVGGMGVMTAFTLGAPIPLGAAITVMGAGVLASGLGTLAASLGVLRRRERVPRLIKAGAVAGLPLGGTLTALGVTSLTRWTPLVVDRQRPDSDRGRVRSRGDRAARARVLAEPVR